MTEEEISLLAELIERLYKWEREMKAAQGYSRTLSIVKKDNESVEDAG